MPAKPKILDRRIAAETRIFRIEAVDLEFANEIMTGAGEAVDKSAPKKWRAEAAAEKAEWRL